MVGRRSRNGAGLIRVALALVLWVIWAAAPVDGQEIRALTVDQVIRMITAGVPEAQILGTANEACLGFRVEGAAETQLRDSGGTDALIGGLRSACYRAPAPPVQAQPERQPTTVAAAAPAYSPGSAMVRSLVIPGLGQFYTRRPALGALFLAGWGAALGIGLFSQEVTVECLARVTDDVCPAGQVRDEVTERPMLIVGVGAAVAIAVISAVHASSTAKSANSRAQTGGGDGSGFGSRLPVVPQLDYQPTRGVLLGLRIRFR